MDISKSIFYKVPYFIALCALIAINHVFVSPCSMQGACLWGFIAIVCLWKADYLSIFMKNKRYSFRYSLPFYAWYWAFYVGMYTLLYFISSDDIPLKAKAINLVLLTLYIMVLDKARFVRK